MDTCYKNNIFILNGNKINADFYLQQSKNSFVYYKTLFPIYNNLKDMYSIIHKNNTYIYIKRNNKHLQILYNDYLKNKKEKENE